jgi:hypothetical protein
MHISARIARRRGGSNDRRGDEEHRHLRQRSDHKAESLDDHESRSALFSISHRDLRQCSHRAVKPMLDKRNSKER